MFNFESWQKILKLIHFIYFNFQKHFFIWKLKFFSICSIFDDFKLIHRNDDNMIYVKIKKRHYKMKYNDKKKICRMQYYQKTMNFTKRQMFNWKFFWNFIWIIIDEKNQTFFLSRNIIFRNWWNVFLSFNEKNIYNLKWFTNKIVMLKKYMINRTKSNRLIDDMKYILSHTMINQDFYKARTEIFIEKLFIDSNIEFNFFEKTNVMKIFSIFEKIEKHDSYIKQYVWLFNRFRKNFDFVD